ncbi:hypothetical protein [Flavobacterium sp. 25HG05S-40]|uniref:hypothetical protein n=1 Tax=Flavobacterium sp. 25HG05S-40 TaxID=3458682 RepID=UPI00404398FC
MSGIITRKKIIEDEALQWGETYAKNLQPAVDKNKEFVASILALNAANEQVRNSRNDKELQVNLKKSNELGEQAIGIWKEQNQLELALISTKKKNELATEGTNKALVKERTLLSETNKEIKQQVRESLGLVTAYERLNKQRNESQKRLADLLSAEKRNNIEIARATVEFDKLDARVKAVDAAIKNYSKNIGNYSSAFSGLNETARSLISTFGLVTGIALFGTVVKDIFNVVKDFDRQLIAVGKTTNISGEALKQFGREVVELGDKLDGITVDGLIQSAEVAGQLGVTGTENILKFSTAIEKLKLTSNIISDEQVGQFAKFIEVSSDSFDNADRLASVITQLGNSYATTEAEVLANATEIQKGIAVYKTSAQGVLALGSATSTLGSEAEASRSAIQSTFSVINNAIASGANLEKVLKLTGLTQKELSKQFNQDATGVFVKFVGGLAKAKSEGENLARVLSDVEITEKRAFTVIGALAANYGVLEGSIAQANKEYQVNKALNKEVAAASESIASIVADLRDKWEAYVLQVNDAEGGTNALTKSLKFLRDNFKQIIDFTLKAGAVFLTYLGVVKTYNFVIAASSALQVAWTAGQIRFALATGIGTQSILSQAEAARAATVAQNGLNVATKATPWGLIAGLVAAAVAAYMVFNDTLSETEIRVKAVNDAQKEVADSENLYTNQRDKRREKEFKAIEDEISLRRAKGEDSKKLDEEEIRRKVEIIKGQEFVLKSLEGTETERTKKQIEESNKRVAQAQKEFDDINSLALRNPFGESVKDKNDLLVKEKADNDALKATLTKKQEIYKSEYDKFNKLLTDLEQQNNVDNAAAQAEIDKKAIAARKKRLKEIYDAEKKAADDLFKLQQFRLQVAIDMDNEIVNNEKASFDERITAFLDSNQLLQTKIKEAAENELKNLGKYNEDKGVFIRELSDLQIEELIKTGSTSKKLTTEQQLIYEKYQASLTTAAKKGEADRQKLVDAQANVIQKQIDLQDTKLETQQNKEIEAENQKFLKILEVNKDNFEIIEKATEGHEKKLFDISQKYSRLKIEQSISAIELLLQRDNNALEGSKLSAEKRAEVEKELSDLKKGLSEIDVENNQAANAKKLANDEETAKEEKALRLELKNRTIELAQQAANAVIDLANAIFSAKISNIDAEIQESNDFYDQQIEAAGNDNRQKKLLEEEKEKRRIALEKKKRKAEYDAAVFSKVVSLATIAAQTAMASIAALAPPPIGLGPVFGGSLLPFIIGTGAVQAAIVLATPLPKYKDGRKDGPDEWAIVGDGKQNGRGVREVISEADGSNPLLTPDRPTAVFLRKKQKVHKSLEDYKKYVNTGIAQDIQRDNLRLKEFTSININQSNGGSKELLDELKRNTEAVRKSKASIHLHNKFDLGHELWKLSNTNWNKR